MRQKRHEFDSWVGKIPWRRAWQPTPVFLPGESPGQRSLAGHSPQGCRVRHDWNGLACTHGNTKRSCDSHSGAWKEQINILRPGVGAREKEPGPLMPLSYCTCAGLPTPQPPQEFTGCFYCFVGVVQPLSPTLLLEVTVNWIKNVSQNFLWEVTRNELFLEVPYFLRYFRKLY